MAVQVTNAPANQSLNLGSAPFTVDLDTVFTDPDGAQVSYTYLASPSGIVSLSADSDNVLSVSPEEVGTTTVTLSAMNVGSTASVTTSFDVTVLFVQGAPPTVSQAMPDISLSLPPDTKINLANHFSDTDAHDKLTYTAVSSDTDVAEVSISDNFLNIAPKSTGTVNITVTATDRGNAAISDTFEVNINVASDTDGNSDLITYIYPQFLRDCGNGTYNVVAEFYSSDVTYDPAASDKAGSHFATEASNLLGTSESGAMAVSTGFADPNIKFTLGDLAATGALEEAATVRTVLIRTDDNNVVAHIRSVAGVQLPAEANLMIGFKDNVLAELVRENE